MSGDYSLDIEDVALGDVTDNRVFQRRHSVAVHCHLLDAPILTQCVKRPRNVRIPRAYPVNDVDVFVFRLLKVLTAAAIVDQGREGMLCGGERLAPCGCDD